MNKEKQGFIEDLGILFSNDPVSIDKASIDLVVSGNSQDVISQVHPRIDYLHQLKYAENLGLGSLYYKLIEI